jgi:hypothetical protein
MLMFSENATQDSGVPEYTSAVSIQWKSNLQKDWKFWLNVEPHEGPASHLRVLGIAENFSREPATTRNEVQ